MVAVVKVYILLGHYPGSAEEIVEVYAKQKDAEEEKQRIEDQQDPCPYFSSYSVKEFEVMVLS